MEERLIKTIGLKNGLTGSLFDGSRKIAGDRWFVSVILRIDIPVNEETVNEKSVNAPVKEVAEILGNPVVFEKKMDRNFIDEQKKDEIVNGLVESLITGLSSYLSHEKFAEKFVAKSYKAAAERRKWYSTA